MPITVTFGGPDDSIANIAFVTGLPHNALPLTLVNELRATISDVAARNPRIVVVRGDSTAFSGGADLDGMSGMDAVTFETYLVDEYRLFESIEALRCLTVAVLTGPCVGNAAELALAFDFRLVVGDVKFGFPEVLAGVFGPSGRLSRYVGVGVARELLLTGRLVRGAEAVRLGLASAQYETDDEAVEFIARLARSAPRSVAHTKMQLRTAYRLPGFVEQEDERAHAMALFATSDAGEGMRAAMERRPAQFTGR